METTHFTFYNNTSPGVYPIVANPYSIKISNPAETISRLQTIVSPNPMINITAFGPVGTGYIEGNFNLVAGIGPGGGMPQHVICHFKVKR
jgi:acyl-CoA hydrolase